MFRGLYTSATSLVANNRRIDIVSNNLANINTTAFKKDEAILESFEEVLLMKRHGVYKNYDYSKKGFSFTEQGDRFYVKIPDGYVRTKGKTADNYSKEAVLHVDDEGYLSTFYKDNRNDIYENMGNRVYGRNGFIRINGELSFDEAGNVMDDGNIIDNLIFVPSSDVIGTMSGGVRVERSETNFNQGQLLSSKNPLDFAIDGEGFFQVRDGEDVLYTRNGSFKLNKDHQLVTSDGLTVLGQFGEIVINSKNFEINEFGEVIIDNKTVDKLKLIKMSNTNNLMKVGQNNYKMTDGFDVQEEEFDSYVRQGFLERSNTNNLDEMIKLIQLHRNYESSQKVIAAYDNIMDKAVNVIGRV